MDPYLASAIIAIVRLIMSCVNNYSLRYFSRRPLIIASSIGMAICMGLSGLFTHFLKTGEYYFCKIHQISNFYVRMLEILRQIFHILFKIGIILFMSLHCCSDNFVLIDDFTKILINENYFMN